LADVARYATTPVTESGLLRMLLKPAVTGQAVTPEQALAVLAGIRAVLPGDAVRLVTLG
jgi:hypothetical protein